MQLAIKTSQPFSFAQTLAFVDRFPPCLGEYVTTSRSLTAAITVGTTPVAFTLRSEHDTSLVLEVADRTPAATQHVVATRAAAFVGATDDVAAFYAKADGDRALAPLVRQLHGLHHVRFLTLGEIAVYSVLMQRAPITIAAALKRRFLAAFGKTIDVPTGDRISTLYALPELAELRRLDADTIAAAIKHRGKAERIVEVVRGVADLGEDFLREAPYTEARDALLAIRGIGPFSAAAILLRGLGRMDELPWLPQFAAAARELYGTSVSREALVARYGTSIGYWSYYVKTGVPRLSELDERRRAPPRMGASARVSNIRAPTVLGDLACATK